MTAPTNCQLIGRWRIVESDLWDRDYLDLVEPAAMTIRADGRGEIAFGAMQASLDLEYGRSAVFFSWAGFDEMDEVSGSGSAQLLDDGSLEIEFAYHLGDEAILKAERAISSDTCWRGRAMARTPIHPGEILADEIEELGLTSGRACAHDRRAGQSGQPDHRRQA